MDSLDTWLQALGLERYASVFADNDVDLDAVRLLTESDLEALGVSLGHRRKLLKAIAELNGAAAREVRIMSAVPPPIAPEAERRQLTVMFCDLVGSTELSRTLDPEALRDLMRGYQQTCSGVIEKYAGHVAQYLGDGLMVYFGWPRAHEDDAERAVRAALEIIDVVKDVSAPQPLKVRIGIATGAVVVGETGGGDASVPKLAVGETPNVAARLQALAGPDEIVISPSTHRLVAGAFDNQDLGEQTLKGIAKPTHAYRILRVSEADSRFEAAHLAGLTPLVGREQEIALLIEHWQLAQEGEGQVVLLSGEPGIGKSRILSALRERLEGEGAQALRLQCSPYYVNSAFYPLIDNFERALKFARDESPESKLDKLEALVVAHYGRPRSDVRFIASILSIPCEERYGPAAMTPQKHKDETLRVLVDVVEATARQQSSVMLFEDLHWADPTTLEVLDLLIGRNQRFPLLAVFTYRPEFQCKWTGHGHVTALNLSKLTRAQSEAMIDELAGGKLLPRDLLEQILIKTDGVPLFVEELTKSILESGELRDAGDRYEYVGSAHQITIPSTLRDSLMARLDRFAPIKEIAQIGAAIGREFSYELISAVAPMSSSQLDNALTQLTDSGLAFRRGTPPEASYTFKHALVQDAAYDSLLKSRRQELHGKIARVLAEHFPEEVKARPAFVAHHYTEAGLPAQAIRYWTHAGQLALERSANIEAISHFIRGLDLLRLMPPTEVDSRQELALWLGLCPAYIATRGFSTPEVERAALRSRELCEELGEVEGAALAIVGKFAVHLVRAELRQARIEADAGLQLARKIEDTQLVALMNMLIGDLSYWEGNFGTARRYLREALIPWEISKAKSLAERSGIDAHCVGLGYVAHCEFAMGYPDRSRVAMAESLRDAQKLGHAQSNGHCLGIAAWLAVFRRDLVAARKLAKRTIDYCHEQRLMFWEASGYLVDGWALIQEGKHREGTARMQQGLAIRRAAGAALVHSCFDAVLAECHAAAGEVDTGLTLIDEGLTHVEWSGERISESELHRVRGVLLLANAPESNAEAAAQCFDRAIAVARRQGARLFELRSSMSLARLQRAQGKRKQAHDLLAPIYNWFTEGFDTKDLMEAKALLEELAA